MEFVRVRSQMCAHHLKTPKKIINSSSVVQEFDSVMLEEFGISFGFSRASRCGWLAAVSRAGRRARGQAIFHPQMSPEESTYRSPGIRSYHL